MVFANDNIASVKMVSQPILSAMPKTSMPNIAHRTHYGEPSSGGYHQHHHVYHSSPSDGYGHGHSSGGGGGHGHHSDHGGKKRSVALSALTLLAFLFFLNILQNCIQEQMDDMNPQVIVMTARIKDAQKRLEDDKAEEEPIPEDDSKRTFVALQKTTKKHKNSDSFPEDRHTIKINLKNNNNNDNNNINRKRP